MTLLEVVRRVEGREKTLTLYDPPDQAVVEELREYFASQQVRVERGAAEGGPDGFALLSRGEEVLAAVGAHELSLAAEGGLGNALGGLLDHLDDTTFTSYDMGQMEAASREVEDRAWRVGSGTLHAGFQRVKAIQAQADVYADLASRDLEVHAYAGSGDPGVEIGDVTLHVEDTEELARAWFVIFDGDSDPAQQCALLAEERGDREFYGFWTYDPAIVTEVLDYLEGRFLGPGARTDGRRGD